MVTPALFAKYRSAADFAAADPRQFEREIQSTGFFRNKTKSILGMAQALLERHGGQVPDTMEALVALPGVGRKTANVVLGNAFGKNEGIVVDTHVQRISGLLKLTRETTPEKIERDLMDARAAQRLDDLLAPAHSPRAQDLHRAPAEVRERAGSTICVRARGSERRMNLPPVDEASLVRDRRDLHQHPELGFQETRTAALAAERLRQLGFDVRTGVGTHRRRGGEG